MHLQSLQMSTNHLKQQTLLSCMHKHLTNALGMCCGTFCDKADVTTVETR